MTLLLESPDPDMFSHERLFDPEVRRLLGRVHLEHDTDADVLYFNEQRLLYSVEVELTDGRQFSREIEFPRDRPATGWSEICAKIQTLCDGVLTSTQIDRAMLPTRGRTCATATKLDIVCSLRTTAALSIIERERRGRYRAMGPSPLALVWGGRQRDIGGAAHDELEMT